jgi:hypothetical protein
VSFLQHFLLSGSSRAIGGTSARISSQEQNGVMKNARPIFDAKKPGTNVSSAYGRSARSRIDTG